MYTNDSIFMKKKTKLYFYLIKKTICSKSITYKVKEYIVSKKTFSLLGISVISQIMSLDFPYFTYLYYLYLKVHRS